MRFKKGSKVEVLFKDKVPSGCWHCAEVISGNGDYYTFKCAMGAQGEVVFEKVSAKLIRPFPPLVTIPACWWPGDVVEVLHDNSWKMATVSKVLRGNDLVVRLAGTLNEFKIRNYDIRLRQSWIDGKWVIVGKGSWSYDDKKSNKLSSPVYNWWKSDSTKWIKANLDSHVEKDHVHTEKSIYFHEPRLGTGKIMKRGLPTSNFYPQGEAHRNKFRAVEKDGRCHRVIGESPSTVPGNFDLYSRLENIPGEKETYNFMNNRTVQFPEIDVQGIRENEAFEYAQLRSSEFSDGDDVASSVDSCGHCDNPVEWPYRILSCSIKYNEDQCSDAESVCHLHPEEENSSHSSEEELAKELHRLELHAYRCTLGALHASGPLSWEQETLVTNLRISLHISNDEHLMELRKLISKEITIPGPIGASNSLNIKGGVYAVGFPSHLLMEKKGNISGKLSKDYQLIFSGWHATIAYQVGVSFVGAWRNVVVSEAGLKQEAS